MLHLIFTIAGIFFASWLVNTLFKTITSKNKDKDKKDE